MYVISCPECQDNLAAKYDYSVFKMTYFYASKPFVIVKLLEESLHKVTVKCKQVVLLKSQALKT